MTKTTLTWLPRCAASDWRKNERPRCSPAHHTLQSRQQCIHSLHRSTIACCSHAVPDSLSPLPHSRPLRPVLSRCFPKWFLAHCPLSVCHQSITFPQQSAGVDLSAWTARCATHPHQREARCVQPMPSLATRPPCLPPTPDPTTLSLTSARLDMSSVRSS